MRQLFFVVLGTAFLAACSPSTPAPAADATAATTTPPAAAATAPPAAAVVPATPAPTASAEAGAPGAAPSPTPAATAQAAAAAAPTEPAAPPAPTFHEVTLPSGTALSVTLATAVASDTSQVEDRVRGTLARPIVVKGATIVPEGAEVIGTVIEANRSARVKGRASLAIRFDRLVVHRETHRIQTARIAREAEGTKSQDAKKIGVGAGVGAIVGGIAGGGSGAAIGAAVGGGAGTGAVLATRGKEVELVAGTTVRTTLTEPLTLMVQDKPGTASQNK